MGKPQRLLESMSTIIHVYQNLYLLESTSTRIHAYQNLPFSTNAVIRLTKSYRRPSKTAYVYAHVLTTKTPNYLFTSFSIYSFSLLYATSYSQQELYTLRFRQNLYYSFKSSLKSLCALILRYVKIPTTKIVNKLKSPVLTIIIALVREQLTII